MFEHLDKTSTSQKKVRRELYLRNKSGEDFSRIKKSCLGQYGIPYIILVALLHVLRKTEVQGAVWSSILIGDYDYGSDFRPRN